jgi:formylglycine-generating enzyme required for sulfatase activity
VKLLFPIFAFLLFCKICIAEEDFRTWTSSDGRTLEARFVEQVGSNVKIKNEAGREFTLPITRFSQADQDYAQEAAARALFQMPEPFEDRGKGAIIIASATGKVTVIPAPRYSGSQEVKPVARDVIVGEPLPHGSTIITEANAEANLLLTTGSLAKVGPNSKLLLSAFWQKEFRASAKKVTDLKEETSPSRVAFKLETGDLVVDVKKLNRESSFMIESPVGVAGIRGTQFGLSVDSKSTELAVLEGKVGFKDANQQTENVETAQKVVGAEGGVSDVSALPETKKIELANAVAESKKVASKYDLTRLANTVEGYATKPNYIVKSALDMELIWCKPGSFIMGEGGNAHPVILTKGFYLGKYEVTQEQYEKVMGNNPSKFKGENLPVEEITWDDAMAFCKKLSEKEKGRIPVGWEFTLPTESQWEYACRAGTTTKYSWGDDINSKLANYADSGLKKTRAVGSYRPNAWGFYDMHGNVIEWCQDWLGPYKKQLAVDPVGPSSGSKRVFRGGSYGNRSSHLNHAARNMLPSNPFYSRGFRIALKKQK